MPYADQRDREWWLRREMRAVDRDRSKARKAERWREVNALGIRAWKLRDKLDELLDDAGEAQADPLEGMSADEVLGQLAAGLTRMSPAMLDRLHEVVLTEVERREAGRPALRVVDQE